jgi:hypothetical protein
MTLYDVNTRCLIAAAFDGTRKLNDIVEVK